MNGTPNQHIPVYRPPTDHLPTINRQLTDHLPTDHLPITYRPLFYGAACSRLPRRFGAGQECAIWEKLQNPKKLLGRVWSCAFEKYTYTKLCFYFLSVNLLKSLALIGCCPIQFFTIRTAHPHRSTTAFSIFELFCSQISKRQATTKNTW